MQRQYSSVSQKGESTKETEEPVPPPTYTAAVHIQSGETRGEPVPIELHHIHSQPELPSLQSGPEPGSRRTCPPIMENKGVLMAIGGLVAVIALLLAIVLPISFSSLEYYNLGFVRQKTTGEIKRDKVYGPGGRHLVGPDYEFRPFMNDAHFEEYERINVFASDRLQVSISAQIQYFLRKHQLALLHRKYDIQYETILRNNAQDAIKNRATQFETREFLRDRSRVEQALFHAVRERLGGPCCELGCEATDSCYPGCRAYSLCEEENYGLYVEVRYFQLTELDIPGNLEDQFLRGLILDEQTETEQFKQDAQLERKNTDAQVKQIENEAQEISQNATSQSTLISAVTRANATALVERARTDGLKHLYSELNINTQEHKASFDYLRTLQSQENVHLAVDYQTLIQGPMSLGNNP